MKPVKKLGSLKLSKETLRTLSSEALATVGGASADGAHVCIPAPPVDLSPILGEVSSAKFVVCNGTSITSWLTPNIPHP